MVLVSVVLIICIPSVLDAFVEKHLVGVDSVLSLLQGEDVFWWFWWMLRTAGKVIHAHPIVFCINVQQLFHYLFHKTPAPLRSLSLIPAIYCASVQITL